ncbi:MAG: hypothetical protein MUF33_02090 [Candidatus Nanopelagicales bacterium]|nr:hypothetical protein [Candidatus Nanopelagicales bacterium]
MTEDLPTVIAQRENVQARLQHTWRMLDSLVHAYAAMNTCPYCKAPALQPCRTARGTRPGTRTAQHTSRRELAWRQCWEPYPSTQLEMR